MKCARCNRSNRGATFRLQNHNYGPTCAEVVRTRIRLKESAGLGQPQTYLCDVTGIPVRVSALAKETCGVTACAACRFNSPKLAELKCDLEVRMSAGTEKV